VDHATHHKVAGIRRAAKSSRVLAEREEAALLANWLAGPGARPTAADKEHWVSAVRDGRLPRRRLAAG